MKTANYEPVFRCKCVLCGNIENKMARDIDDLGPACSKCMGPMIANQVSVKIRPTKVVRK